MGLRRHRADQKSAADITYVPTWAGFVYLAVVLDVWSRRVVGWATADTLYTQVVLDALNMAVWRRRPEAVIHYSDKGCQYTSVAFGQRCAEAGVLPSTGWQVTASTTPWPSRSSPRSSASSSTAPGSEPAREADLAVIDYIEGFYNTRRRHSALDYQSPINYEEMRRPPAA
ncbi:MAG TPA: DDE-type integrase/transposase/recombinase [Acidimicrobiales bacterium]|nr:DDE-type integrase/transposase/recombinase [Acidimicrobiales bacterium]